MSGNLYKLVFVLFLFLSTALELFAFEYKKFDPAESFNKRFDISKDVSGNVVAIKSKALGHKNKEKINIENYFIGLLKDAKANYELGFSNDEEMDEKDWHAIDSVLTDENVSLIQELLNKNESRKILNEVNILIENIENSEEYNVLCRPHDKLYYFKRNLAKEIFSGIFSLAKSLIPAGQWLDGINYIIKRSLEYVELRRSYHQHMLEYYLTNFRSNSLGLDARSLDGCLSSLEDDRMAVYDIFSLVKASKEWHDFGWQKYNKTIKKTQKRIRKQSKKFSQVGPFIDELHAWVKFKKGGIGIVDFSNKIFILSGRPGYSYIGKRPKYIKNKRLIFEATMMASKFVPLPYFSTIVNYLLGTNFKKQVLVEGRLAAYFEMINDHDLANLMFDQTANPIIMIKDAPIY